MSGDNEACVDAGGRVGIRVEEEQWKNEYQKTPGWRESEQRRRYDAIENGDTASHTVKSRLSVTGGSAL